MRKENKFIESKGMIDEVVSDDDNTISSTEIVDHESEKREGSIIKIDLRKLILYSEIMKPKYEE